MHEQPELAWPHRLPAEKPKHLAARLVPPIGVALCWLLLQLAFLLVLVPQVLDGTLIGPDSHMRMVRVGELLQGEGWYDASISRSNAPYGETLHWSRPFDIVLVLFSLPPTVVLGLDAGLNWVAGWVSPFLHLACAAAMAWAAAPVVSRGFAVLAALILLVQPAMMLPFLPGRPDHHAFLVLLFVLTLGWTFRVLTRPGAMGTAAAAGATSGLALWASMELVIALAISTAALALAWVIEGGADRRRQNFAFAAGLSAVLVLALLVERPPDAFLSIVYDKVSIVHLTFALLLVGIWAAAPLLRNATVFDSPAARLAYGLAAAIIAALCLHQLFPKLLGGPMVDVDPLIRDIWLDGVAEMQPMIPVGAKGLRLFLQNYGSALIGLAFLAWLLFREHRWPQQRAWLAVALAIAIALPLGMLHIRMAVFAAAVMTLPLAEMAGRFLSWSGGVTALLPRVLLRSLVLVGTVAGGAAVAQVLVPADESESKAFAGGTCPVTEIAAHLARTPGDAPLTILAFPDHGPELLYRTPFSVVATPYHRNGQGILDSYSAMTTSEPHAARRILEARGVDLVLLCPGPTETAFFAPRPVGAAEGPTLYERLLSGQPPTWLRAVPLPPDLAANFKLFALEPRERS